MFHYARRKTARFVGRTMKNSPALKPRLDPESSRIELNLAIARAIRDDALKAEQSGDLYKAEQLFILAIAKLKECDAHHSKVA